MIRNVMRVILLDVDFFREAASDSSLNRQAAVVVVVASGMAGVGSAIAENVPVVASIPVGIIAGVRAIQGRTAWYRLFSWPARCSRQRPVSQRVHTSSLMQSLWRTETSETKRVL